VSGAGGKEARARGIVLGQLLPYSGMGGAENYAVLLANEHARRGDN